MIDLMPDQRVSHRYGRDHAAGSVSLRAASRDQSRGAYGVTRVEERHAIALNSTTLIGED